MGFSHIDSNGNAVMVDVGEKEVTKRKAVAAGSICMSPECFASVRDGTSKKGAVLSVARVAGIMAAKRTSDLIPLCHPLNPSKITVEFTLHPETCEVKTVCAVCCEAKTGAEMEALTGVTVALLTVYDMCKAADRSMKINNIHLVEKTGGKSGHYKL
ncbi:MAG: cyclic pyranopterin monophosphate synthase MoaC [Treponema sp.]|nr:cyclic pyranopterin monophosphate synthase MoaC [Treponema sp.]